MMPPRENNNNKKGSKVEFRPQFSRSNRGSGARLQPKFTVNERNGSDDTRSLRQQVRKKAEWNKSWCVNVWFSHLRLQADEVWRHGAALMNETGTTTRKTLRVYLTNSELQPENMEPSESHGSLNIKNTNLGQKITTLWVSLPEIGTFHTRSEDQCGLNRRRGRPDNKPHTPKAKLTQTTDVKSVKHGFSTCSRGTRFLF